MLVHEQLSNGTWGRVLSLRDDQTTQVAQRPTPGRMKTITHSETVSADIAPSDPTAAAIYAPMVIHLGEKTWAKQVPDIDPLWVEWLAADRITEELLGDVPEPSEAIFARQKAAKLAAIDNWLTLKEASGIDVGNGITLKSDANAAVQLSVYISSLAAGEPILVSDVNGKPHIVDLKDLPALAAAYKTELVTRRTTWATIHATIDAATTVEELDAINIPQ